MNSVMITGADRNIGLALCREFLQKGWLVFAGRYAEQLRFLDELQAEYPDTLCIVPADCSSRSSLQEAARQVGQRTRRLDMLVHNAAHFGSDAGSVLEQLHTEGCKAPFSVNALGAIRLVQAFLPLMEEGGRRLCFVSSEAGSVSVAARNFLSGYCMSKTALNMAVRLMFNELRPRGYTFRLFHPGWVRSPEDGVSAAPGKLDPRQAAQAAAEQFSQDRDWENQLAIIDYQGVLWPF